MSDQYLLTFSPIKKKIYNLVVFFFLLKFLILFLRTLSVNFVKENIVINVMSVKFVRKNIPSQI
jgi:hypothetical protein